MALIFEPTLTYPRAWMVCNSETGEATGCVEWLERLGAYGFGAAPGAAAFSDPAAMLEVGRFLDEVNREP